MWRWKRALSWRRRRALRAARMLDEMVDAHVAAVPMLAEDLRPRTVEQLVQLVSLAHVYRHFAAGWITRPTFDRRCREIVARLDDQSGVGPVSGGRLTARE